MIDLGKLCVSVMFIVPHIILAVSEHAYFFISLTILGISILGIFGNLVR